MGTPVPVPDHYRKSADKQIGDFLRPGIIKRCHHHTPWLSRGLFIGKKNKKDSQEVKVRLVADFSLVNRVLKSPNYPNKGSDAHLKQISPEARVFCTMDFSHGYYQVPIREKDHNLFAFLVPQGKYRFCRLPQGSKPTSDLFNIISDPEIRNIPEIQKNNKSYKLMDPIIDRILA